MFSAITSVDLSENGRVLFGAAAAAAGVAVLIYGFNPFSRWRYRKVPGDSPNWLVGTFPSYVSKGFHKTNFELQKKYGPITKVFLGRHPLILVADPDYARQILLRNSDRINPFRGGAISNSREQQEIDKASLINSRAPQAKALRGAWQPTFNPSSLSEYAPIMNNGAEKLLVRLANAEGKEVNIWRIFGDMTFDVVGSAAFGVDFDTQTAAGGARPATEDSNDLVTASATVFKAAGVGQGSFLQIIGLVAPVLVPLVRPFAAAAEALGLLPRSLDEVLRALGTLRREAMSLTRAAREGGCPLAASGGGGKPAAGSFLHRLIQHKDAATGCPLSDPAVAAQAVLFMLAGYETTANTLAFCLYNVALSPGAEARVLEEVDRFGREAAPSYSDLQDGRFPYITAVIHETLRLFPPATATAIRTLAEDTTLGSTVLPRGTNVLVNILAMHHDEALWESPSEFRPERFLKGAPGFKPHHPYAHLPFGAGGRQCIGMRFALEEATIALVRFYQKYTFRLSPGQVPLELGRGATQGPKDGVFGIVHSRD